jgi:porin
MIEAFNASLSGAKLSHMRSGLLAAFLAVAISPIALAQEDKKTDDDKPADPDTGESTIEEKTLGLLPNPLE